MFFPAAENSITNGENGFVADVGIGEQIDQGVVLIDLRVGCVNIGVHASRVVRGAEMVLKPQRHPGQGVTFQDWYINQVAGVDE